MQTGTTYISTPSAFDQRKEITMKKKLLILCMCGLLAVSAAALVACDSEKDDLTESEEATVETSADTVAEGATETAEAPTEVPTEQATEAPVETDTEGREISKTLNGKTPYALYAEAETLYKTNYEVEQEMKITMNMNDGGSEMHIETTEKAWFKFAGGNVYAKTESYALFEERAVMEMWYVDGKLYTEDLDENLELAKVVMTISPENAELYYGLELPGDTLMPMPEDWLKDTVFAKTEDGLYLVSLNITQEMLAAADEDVWGDLAGEGVTLNSMTYHACFRADGSLAYISYGADMDMMGMACIMEAKVVLSNAGTTQVTPPADADTYQEVKFEI